MNTNIVNASPMSIARGVQDLSTRVPAVEAEAIPTHLPKIYIFAEKGPLTPQLVVGGSRDQMYGSKTFDLRSPYATHTTVLSNLVNAQGNQAMIQRVLPDDAGPRANLTLWLDVVETNLPNYVRNSDGTVKRDALTGQPLVNQTTPTVAGHKAKWVVTRKSNPADDVTFGQESPQRGNLGVANGPESTRYPILSLRASSFGGVFNNTGIRLWAPTAKTQQIVNSKSLDATGTYPLRIAVVRRASVKKTATLVATETGEPSVEFTFKPGVINPLTESRYSLQDIFLDNYRSIKDARFAPKYGDFGDIRVYHDYIAEIAEKLYDKEVAHGGAVSTELEEGDFWLFNFLSGQYSSGEQYHTFQVDTTATDALSLSESYNIFAGGGSDGTLTPAKFDELVALELEEYANPASPLMNTAVMAESIFYDTGFSVETKKAACKFISERKDTAVILSTYVVDGQELTAAEEHSLAVTLRTHLQMFPESDYFGTNTVRGMIIGRYGMLRDSQFTKKLPVTVELAVMASKMMGAADGHWKEAATFDRRPLNELSLFDANTINVTYTSNEVRNKDWDVGLNFVASATRQTLYFPALKTVYDNDTSVLTSFFNMMACVELQKVGERVHRMYSGNVRLSDAQLVERVNEEVEKQTNGRFAGLVRVVPAAMLTDADTLRGYSWTLPIKAYFNNMKTVQTLDIRAYRMSDYGER